VRLPGTSPPPPPREAHHIYQYLHLAGAVGAQQAPTAPHLTLTDAERAEAARSLGSAPQPPPFWLGLNAGAAYGPAKRWPEGRFGDAALAVHRATGCGCVLVGGEPDVPTAGRIAQQLLRARVAPVVNLAGRTSLRQLCATLGVCRVVLTNDSGPMHVAAAVGTPVVVPFGSTSPELTGPGLPGSPGHRLLSVSAPCSPCFRPQCPIDLRCLHGITVESAVAAVLQLVADA
jgi:heptosyltransferase II